MKKYLYFTSFVSSCNHVHIPLNFSCSWSFFVILPHFFYAPFSGRLGIKTVSESPEIRNLSERGDSEDPEVHSGSEADGGDGNYYPAVDSSPGFDT